jgi:hypothetical protein
MALDLLGQFHVHLLRRGGASADKGGQQFAGVGPIAYQLEDVPARGYPSAGDQGILSRSSTVMSLIIRLVEEVTGPP